MKIRLLIAVLATASASLAAPVLASGSGGGGSGTGGYRSGSFFPSGGLIDPLEAAYSRGQSAYRKRIACKTCAFPKGRSKDVEAADIAARVQAGEFDLSRAQREDVMIYLRRRYALRG